MEKLKNLKPGGLKKQSIFLMMAVAMCVLVVGIAIYSIIFVGGSLEEALDAPKPSTFPIKFDTEGFENLKLVK